MNAYAVTAGNCAFWQSLVVIAPNTIEAAAKFSAYLAATASSEEYEMAQAADLEGEPSDYEYSFDDADIEIFDGDSTWTGAPSINVEMMDSGSNG